MQFKDRSGNFLNRKKLKIISQSPTEMIVDVERHDEVTEEGTQINAQIFNNFQAEIDSANSKADSALDTSITSKATADNADRKSDYAVEKANTAISDSTIAKEKSIAVEQALADRGATILVGQAAQSIVEFDSDPQTQINKKVSKIFSDYPSKSALSKSDAFVVQDGVTQESRNVSMSALASAIYPIGAIYLSVNSTDPTEIFGGAWERLTGKFLLGAGDTFAAGTTGGEEKHSLTIAESPAHTHLYDKSKASTEGTNLSVAQMPAHTHRVWTTDTWSHNTVGLRHADKPFGVAGVDQREGNEMWAGVESGDNHTIIEPMGSGQSHYHAVGCTATLVSSSGQGNAHNNMPPYLAVYMWKRIA